MLRLRPSLHELGAAVAGAAALGLLYAAGRSLGLTSANLAQTLAPDRPSAGRAAQLAIGTLAALPATRARTPTLALAHGAAIGALASREARGFSAAAHALAALLAQRIAARK